MSSSADPQHVYELIRKIRPLYLTLCRAVEKELAGTGVTVAERGVLEQLLAFGPKTVPEIARSLSLARQPVQRYIDKLLSAGLVQAEENPSHARSYRMALSSKGHAAIRRMRQREEKEISRVAAHITTRDLQGALRVVDALSRGLQ
jgi:DNA-binding MarR family transcriptional regulator